MSEDKQWYINYYNHMEEEAKSISFDSLTWTDLSQCVNIAINEGYFTIKELKERWPHLWGWLEEE
jgi:hypothetical protein